ncbi:MAG: DUF1592 domain-containing protein, partial [Polyangiaceae bacterium]
MRAALPLIASILVAACNGNIGETPSGRGAGGAGNSGGGNSGGAGGGNGGSGGVVVGPGGTTLPNGVGWSTRYPRLTHAQWENTTRDLLRLDAAPGISSTFAPDPVTRFDTSIADRKVSTALFGDYQEAAEQLATTVARDPAKLAKILPAGLPSADPARAQAFVTAFGKRAFRRPLTPDEVSGYTRLFQKGTSLLGGDALSAGAEIVLRAMLQSPHFLYRIESSSEAQGDLIWLSGYEIATRLSYALWNTMPTDELLAAAEAKELDNAEGVQRWAKKLSADAKVEGTIRTFHEQLLKVASFGSVVKDTKRFPGYTPAIAGALQNE